MDSDEAGIVDYEFIDNDSDDSNDVSSHRYQVYVIGEEGILKELELAGYQYIGGPCTCYMYCIWSSLVAVVINQCLCDGKYVTLCVSENPGSLFIATNCDAVTRLKDAQEWAATIIYTQLQVDRGGSMVGAIRGCIQREPLVVGKPSTFMMDYLANEFAWLGYRLDTDILFGQNGGYKTFLVLSGVTTLSVLQSPNNSIQPDFYTNKISDFLSLKAATV
ncbi:PREDICTED: phosphoglycolate phosphatase [Prunus dulcis]|uniref:PREDICTED: phosphoglycolate phosphatase n=1 Tax=Prunus dulcis TaxID=3755 RepID=A0A5E4EG44_PRUDU|nr:PREDICTED: phosphoglycolate phosphatase [Prunus dulcis]